MFDHILEFPIGRGNNTHIDLAGLYRTDLRIFEF